MLSSEFSNFRICEVYEEDAIRLDCIFQTWDEAFFFFLS